MDRNKFLIVDASGFDSIRYSVKEGYSTISEIKNFLSQADIQLVITSPVLQSGEFSYSENPDLFTYRPNYSSFSADFFNLVGDFKKTYWLTSNGTLTADDSFAGGLEFKVFNVNQSTQTNLWHSSKYWKELSPEDRSIIFLARELLDSGSNTAILANEWNLRSQARLENISVFGSSSFLGGMVITGIYSCQKGAKLYYKWKSVDPKWVPRDYKFQDILSLERDRYKNKKGFWFKYD